MLLFRNKTRPSSVGCEVQQSLSQELRVAAAQGNAVQISSLLEKGAAILPDKDGRTALHLAAMARDIPSIHILIQHQAHLNLPDKLGYTALHRACMEGEIEVVRLLLDAGTAVNVHDNVQENTPLHETATKGHAQLVRLLIAAHANLYVRNRTGASALHLASQHGRAKCARVLLEHGCKMDMVDSFNDTPLHSCVRHIHSGVCKLLLSRGAPTNPQNKNGDTPLHLSCNLAHKKLTKLLLQAGASKTIKNSQNETPYDIAARKQNSDLLELMAHTEKVPNTNNTARSGKAAFFGGNMRRSKIRERLRNAREVGSNWHLLFQDDANSSQKMESKTRLSLLHRNSPSGTLEKRKPTSDNENPTSDTYFMDLAGNIKKGNGTLSTTPCACTPWYLKMAHANTQAQQELLDEIDACHHNLSHEISDLKQVTEKKIADLHRGLRKEKTLPRKSRNSEFESPIQTRKMAPNEKGRMVRSRSESELETDAERGRHESCSDSDSGSNISDELEDYWKRASDHKYNRSRNVMTPERATSGSNTSRESNRSSRQTRANTTRPRKKTTGKMASIHEVCQQTMHQFNRVDLDDSCTTPTSNSNSSHHYTAETHNSGASQWERATVSSEGSNKAPDSQSHRISLYSQDEALSNHQFHTFPQPPSMDSGYGTGLSPSPAMSRTKNNCGTNQDLNEVSTQTELDNHEYTELETVMRTSHVHTAHITPPRVRIPPPPRKPLPPVPASANNRRSHSTNV